MAGAPRGLGKIRKCKENKASTIWHRGTAPDNRPDDFSTGFKHGVILNWYVHSTLEIGQSATFDNLTYPIPGNWVKGGGDDNSGGGDDNDADDDGGGGGCDDAYYIRHPCNVNEVPDD
ncbi:hypothetical protein ElyMa_006048900 [Elysia marginata]|uniref:Uncharacterized protein n=1 Tax=Elysia marginata TaxID=1093978 RepID=A0AAV4GKP1_9GAST|nr:hypothetical protein ElyMa_006048900 [Elysia marginata]